MSFSGHTNWVRSAKFSPDGKLAVSCSDDKTLRVWDVVNNKCIKTFHELKGNISNIE